MTVLEFRSKLLAAATVDSCYPPLAEYYQEGTLFGHASCVASAVQTKYGGEIITTTVRYNGKPCAHYWNRIAGVEFDFTEGKPESRFQAQMKGRRYTQKLSGARIRNFIEKVL